MHLKWGETQPSWKSTITRGNMCLIEPLMMQVEHILVVNQLAVVTEEVIETAREKLIFRIS